jgi:hypothetical protein
MEKSSLLEPSQTKARGRFSRASGIVAGVALLGACVLIAAVSLQPKGASSEADELLTEKLVLFKMAPPPEPWSPPENLWMYWGDAPNKRFGHSGDNLRHLVRMGR